MKEIDGGSFVGSDLTAEYEVVIRMIEMDAMTVTLDQDVRDLGSIPLNIDPAALGVSLLLSNGHIREPDTVRQDLDHVVLSVPL